MNEIERMARAINETANKQFNLYMLGKDESFTLARAAYEASSAKLVPVLVEALKEIGCATIKKFDSLEEAKQQIHSAVFWERIASDMQKKAFEALAEYRKWQEGK